MDVRAGHLIRIWIKQNATGGCLEYHTERTKQSIIYGNRSVSLPGVRSSYCQPSSVASYHGSVMPTVMTHVAENHTKEDQRKSLGITPNNEQASHCRRCCASQPTEVDRQASQQMHLSEYHNDTRSIAGIGSHREPVVLLNIVTGCFAISRHTGVI